MKIFLKFLFKRIAVIPLTLFIITIVLYGIVMLMPIESRIDLYMPNSNSKVQGWEERMRERIVKTHHLKEPFPVQYFYWARSLFTSEWGYSPILGNSVLPELTRRSPVTFELMFYALLLEIPLGLMAGVWSAHRKGKISDYITRLAAFIGTSMPDFILAIILLAIFYIKLYWFPPERLSMNYHLLVQSDAFQTFTGFMTFDGLLNGRVDITIDALRHLVLPVFTLSLAHWATLTRITRTQVLDEMDKDYITAAQARGVRSRDIIWKHAFRNALSPSLSSSAISAATLVTSVYVVEKIFNLKGISELITRYGPFVPDAAAVLGFAIYSTLLVLGIMLILDILQALLIPQIKEAVFNNNEHI
jgi:peptide/nickel transport system permease protein